MKKLKLLTSSVLFSLLTISALAQVTVKGTVVDSKSNEPLIGAAVTIEGTTVGISTNLDGTFELTAEEGTKTLVFSYIGYDPLKKEVKLSGSTVDLGTVGLASNVVGLEEVMIVSSIAKDRETPVSISTIDPLIIQEKLGTQEFPEILKTTPSIYTSKEGGGFGDASTYVRGFDSNNVGVLINGIPVNDMENGKVYWSNWAGLSDVAQTIQVQRGLGASKLGLSSVGGTINIITKSTDAKKGGIFKTTVGNDGRRKSVFVASTGLMDNGWAVTVRGTMDKGDGYVKGTNHEGYSYFMNVAKRINDDHRLSFMVFGAPQWHNQRGRQMLISEYKNSKDGIKHNKYYGIREGKVYGGAYGYNYYHKPVMQLNHYWNLNEESLLSTSVYGSFGRGGGRRTSGDGIGYGADGLLDFDSTIKGNSESPITGSNTVIANSVNSHDWYGVLSTLTTNWNVFKVTAGVDGRYYKGFHYREIDDLLGGKFFLDSSNKNRDANAKLGVDDKISYYNVGEVLYTGVFGQLEYVSEIYSGFLSAAISNKSYRRVDYFNYTPENQKSEWQNFLPWSIKGGFNYNLNDYHNVFINAGYVQRTPFFGNVFLNYTNEINEKVRYEKIITTELGYGYKSKHFEAKATIYRTNWRDRGLVRSLAGEVANIAGLNQLHQGLEIETTYKPISKLTIKGMLSIGDWKYQDDVKFQLFDDEQNLLGEFNAYIKDVHVGNSAQNSAAVVVNYEVLPKLRIGLDYVYHSNHYADFDPTNRGNIADKGVDAWKIPDVGIVDMNFNYKFKLGKLNASIYGNVNNVLDTEYVSKARDGKEHNANTALVYYGFGRTWSTGLRIKF
ncbi:TonB-dependent receptor [Prolixibacteraceae bacterium JC049]|nr:TonB-dependent receptor [Prolixibacteraceae bacterium JC049]